MGQTTQLADSLVSLISRLDQFISNYSTTTLCKQETYSCAENESKINESSAITRR